MVIGFDVLASSTGESAAGWLMSAFCKRLHIVSSGRALRGVISSCDDRGMRPVSGAVFSGCDATHAAENRVESTDGGKSGTQCNVQYLHGGSGQQVLGMRKAKAGEVIKDSHAESLLEQGHCIVWMDSDGRTDILHADELCIVLGDKCCHRVDCGGGEADCLPRAGCAVIVMKKSEQPRLEL